MELNSKDTDNSPWNHCGWAVVENGHVIELGEELGREGGIFWRNTTKTPLKESIRTIAREWPRLYELILLHARRENLESLELIIKEENSRMATNIQREISHLEKQLQEKRKELEKWS